MSTQTYARSVNEHYAIPGLGEAILAALREAGKDLDALTPADLAPVDHFHTRGHEATMELAQRAGLARGQRVLDAGGGLGGPARTLAAELGCQVTVLDITEAYCRVGQMLSERTGLGDRVRFEHGSALAMPFADASFDVVWTQHSSMNIADKEQLFAEIARVLQPGGRLALHEVMAGPVQPIHFPVPWAREPAISFLRPPDEVRVLLGRAGLRELAWVDQSELSLAWFQARLAAGAAGPPPALGLHLVIGADNFRAALGNVARNLAEERIRIVQGVFERPA